MVERIWRVNLADRRKLWGWSEYEPSPDQFAAHMHPARSKLVSGGERAGKSRWTAEECYPWVFATPPDEMFWIVGPDYKLARPEFKHLLRCLRLSGLLNPDSVRMPADGAWSMRTIATNVEISTRTSAEVETIAGEPPAGLLMVEAAQQSYDAYLRCRGRVAEKRGPLIISGTFEGSFGWFPELWQRWQGDNLNDGRSFSLPSWSNKAIFPGGRQDPEILALERDFPPDVFQERYGAIPCPPPTLVYKTFAHIDHVKTISLNSEWPVQLWCDPGYAGAYAVLFVCIEKGHVYVFDEVYEKGVVVQDIIAACKAKPIWPRVRKVIMDVAGTQHPGQESQVDVWHRMTNLPIVTRRVGIADGIMRVKTFLMDPATKLPRITFDPKCKGCLKEFTLYKYNKVVDGRPEQDEPIKANDHAMDALRYGLVVTFGLVDGRKDWHRTVPLVEVTHRV